MIKITSSRKRYLPSKRKNNQKYDSQLTKPIKTQYEQQTLSSQLATLTKYFRVYDKIRDRNSALKTTIQYSSLTKNKGSFRQKSPGITEFSLQNLQEINENTHKLVDLLKQSQKFIKRQSCHTVDRTSNHSNWMMLILRRKNNGSYGQIIRGPTAAKHGSVLEKARAVTTYRECPPTLSPEQETIEKFIPLGSIVKKKEENKGKKSALSQNRSLLTARKQNPKRTSNQSRQHFTQNKKSRTQPDKTNYSKTCQTNKKVKQDFGFSSLIKKLSQPCKVERHISPWDVSYPL